MVQCPEGTPIFIYVANTPSRMHWCLIIIVVAAMVVVLLMTLLLLIIRVIILQSGNKKRLQLERNMLLYF